MQKIEDVFVHNVKKLHVGSVVKLDEQTQLLVTKIVNGEVILKPFTKFLRIKLWIYRYKYCVLLAIMVLIGLLVKIK